MRLRKATPILGSLALLGLLLSTSIQADSRDKKTTVTFSAPVAIPGVHLEGWGVLPAGTYVFKLMDSATDRHIVEILNKDETKIYAIVLTIPKYRMEATDKTVMTFNEGIRGRPESLRYWFFPGSTLGDEFVYPKARAVELAKETNLPVLATVADIPAEAARPEEPAVIAQLTEAPVVAVRPTGEVVELSQVIETAPPPRAKQAAPAKQVNASPAQAPEQTSAPVETIAQAKLPNSASSLPLIALLGLLALSGAVTVRCLARIPR